MSEELAEHLLTELRDPEPKGFHFQEHVLRQDAGLDRLTESLRAEEPAAQASVLGTALAREGDGWIQLKLIELCDRLAPPGLEAALIRFVEERAGGDDRERFLAGRAAEVLIRLPLDLAARARASELSQGPLRELQRLRQREQAARSLHRPRRVEWAILAVMMAVGLLGTVLAFRALGTMNEGRAALAWLLIRVTFGASLAFFHGYGKVFLGGAGALVASLGNMGFPSPQLFAWAAALAEFAGGILVALGLATRYAALACAFTMAVALYRHLEDPVQRMELALLYFVPMVAAFLVGGGRYSLDQWIRLRFPLERK